MSRYNYNKLIEHEPYVYKELLNSLGQKIKLCEHPIYGDESFVIAICEELNLAEDTCFFDTDDMLAEHKEYEPKFIDGKLFIGESPCRD